jgi:hypothetical protein
MNTRTKLLIVFAGTLAGWLCVTAQPTQGAEAKDQSKRVPAPIENLGIPTSMQSDALAAQQQGKRIFLWRENDELVTASDTPFGQLITLELRYARLFTDDDASFGLFFLTGATQKDSTSGTTYGSESKGPEKTERTGKTIAAFISPRDKLSGEGRAFVFAVAPSEDKNKLRERSEALSNEIKVRIKFEGDKKPEK